MGRVDGLVALGGEIRCERFGDWGRLRVCAAGHVGHARQAEDLAAAHRYLPAKLYMSERTRINESPLVFHRAWLVSFVPDMGISLQRVAWLLALLGVVLFIGGGFVSNETISRAGLIVGLTGVVWAVGLRNRRTL